MEQINKNVTYLGKDFGQFRKNLIDFTRQYFPDTYQDFNESSPGMLFMEMASYVGDVLSYYADNNLKESFLQHATEESNVFDLARTLGYNVKASVPAYTTLDVYHLLPASGSGDAVAPDYRYALNIKPGMRVKSATSNAAFRTLTGLDFGYSSSIDPTEVTIYQADDTTKQPIYYLVKKSVQAVSGTVKTAEFTFGTPLPYDKLVLSDTNVIEIISVEESDGDNWYQVPYLAQDTIFEPVPNLAENDPDLAPYRSSTPYLLKMRKASKRFITRLRNDKKTELQFGAGTSDNNDEEIVPNPDNVGNGLAAFRKNVDVDIDPSNFLYTRAYGQAPSNTTLNITYTIGNGVSDNVDANTITELEYAEYDDDVNATTSVATLNFIKQSIAITNPVPARGAKSSENILEIKNNTLANYATQNRLVTREDYIVRAYSMPAQFGSVSKAYIVPDDQLSQNELEDTRVANPLAMNLYVLGYNALKQLVPLNLAIKENLKTYLDNYRILTDAVNIKDAFIINIGVDFEISVRANYNSNEVLIKCVDALKTFFNTSNWQINQVIVKSDILTTLANVNGVQSVLDVQLKNLYDSTLNYSNNVYDLSTATKNGIIYPSLDPSIFEVKFPNKDIKGRVVSY